MKINNRVFYKMHDEITDMIIDKSADFIIYVSRAMYAYMLITMFYRQIDKNFRPTILGHKVEISHILNGNEYEVVQNG